MDLPMFLDIVTEELALPPSSVDASNRLDDLGAQSIDVVQVMQRVERSLGRSVEGIDLSAVDTVADFFRALVPDAQVSFEASVSDASASGSDALATASGASASDAPASAEEPAGPDKEPLSARQAEVIRWLGDDPLADAHTLTDMIHRRGMLSPEREAYRFEEVPCTYAELARDVQRVARVLRAAGVGTGDAVVLVLGNCREFLPLYHGVVHLRAMAAPIFHQSGPERIAAIARHCRARVIITQHPLPEPERAQLRDALGDHHPTLLGVDEVMNAPLPEPAGPLPRPEPDDVAMLQYTSGTTGASKGVMLTHAALMANVRQMIPPARFHQDDVFVSWLPVYHDMGLITMTMCPLYVGARLVLLPVSLRPHAWLEAITRHRGTMTAAPDFAYRFALRFSGDAAKYDLTSLRFALVAAEPVRGSTIEAFERTHGLRDVLRPGYGLAEICVGAAFWPLDREGLVIDDDGFVSVGRPLPDFEVEIREGDRALPPGERGEICLRSPSCTAGYYRDPERTAAALTSDGFIRTGDLGYLDDQGMLYVVGRLKEVIIVAGRNLAPRELEEIADTTDGIAGSMAVGIDEGDDAGEHLHLFAESRAPRECWDDLSRAVSARIKARLGLRPDRVHMMPRGTLPRTYNGKLQYRVMRKRYLADPSAF